MGSELELTSRLSNLIFGDKDTHDLSTQVSNDKGFKAKAASLLRDLYFWNKDPDEVSTQGNVNLGANPLLIRR